MNNISLMPARPPYVEFEERSEEDRNATVEAGRLVMKEVDFAIVRQIGSKDTYEREAKEWLKDIQNAADRGAYPQEWATAFKGKYDAWKQGRSAPLNGFPLKEWSRMSRARAENYATLGIFTVEDVAAMNEQAMQRAGMGSRADKDAAVAFLEVRTGAVNAEEVAALRAQLADQAQRNKDLEAAIAQINAQLPKQAKKVG